jgi:DNA-binding LacI/PurR family transcriptional regulator
MPVRKTTKGDSRVGLVTRQIREMAYSKGPEWKLPTFRELCGTLEASPTTVLGALDNLEAQNVIYRKDRSGIYVSPSINRKCIWIVVDGAELTTGSQSPFWGILLGLFISEAKRRGETHAEDYGVQVLTPVSDPYSNIPSDIVHMAANGQIDGLMDISAHIDEAGNLLPPGFPHVSYAAEGPWVVGVDYIAGIRMAVEALAQQGCRAVALWRTTDPNHKGEYPVVDEEVAAFQETLAACGLAFDPGLVRDMRGRAASEIGTDQEQGYQLVNSVFGGGDHAVPDGIVIMNDMLTVGALYAMHERKIDVGRDVRIASHANAGSSALFGYDRTITRFQVDPAAIVKSAFAMMDILLNGERPPSTRLNVIPSLVLPEAPARE